MLVGLWGLFDRVTVRSFGLVAVCSGVFAW